MKIIRISSCEDCPHESNNNLGLGQYDVVSLCIHPNFGDPKTIVDIRLLSKFCPLEDE